jgi:heme oxygenase
MAAYEPATSTETRSGARTAGSGGLPARLRRETASLHARVEASTGLPGSISDRARYVALLHRLHGFHAAVEARLADPCWAEDWDRLGIELVDHRRAHLLTQDLEAMRAPTPPPALHFENIEGFAGALGCLYVTEGSALGGRVIGPAIRSAIGDVPTGFFESAGRNHPSPWRTLVTALHRFDGAGGDASAVVEGARSTFRAFELRVAAPNGSDIR